jgi:DNA-binding GntR family transcriptional regulator
VVERAADSLRARDDRAAVIEHSLRAETEQGMAVAFSNCEDFHSVLGGLTGNRALQLVHAVTMRLGWQFFEQFAADDPRVGAVADSLPSTVGPAHRGIADALIAGDAELAVMRMRAHMTATAPTSF